MAEKQAGGEIGDEDVPGVAVGAAEAGEVVAVEAGEVEGRGTRRQGTREKLGGKMNWRHGKEEGAGGLVAGGAEELVAVEV